MVVYLYYLMLFVFTLHFLQEQNIGFWFNEGFSQAMQDKAPIAGTKTFMDVVGQNA